MPLTAKGKKILERLKAEYGEKKGESVFYAMINRHELEGVEDIETPDACRKKYGDSAFLTSPLSGNISETPEGFMLCKDVAIARTGKQTYYAGEPPFLPGNDGKYPVSPGEDGTIIINRPESEVFDAESMASWEGKPVTIEHPDNFVTPGNWSKLAHGTVHNVRRGEGLEADVVMGDLLLSSKDAIRQLKDRGFQWEVSGGYDADYVETETGKGEQRNIRGNHVALVEKGRCGALCAIHDSEGGKMKKWWDKFAGHLPESMRRNFMDEAQREEEKKEEEDEDEEEERKKDKERSLDARIRDAVRKALDEEKKERTAKDTDPEEPSAIEERHEKELEGKDKRTARDESEEEEKEAREKMAREGKDCYGKTGDAVSVLQEIMYRSSVLAPELKRPTMDALGAARTKRAFKDECCRIKRQSLDAAYKTADGKAAIQPFTGGKSSDFFTMDCATVDMAFVGASELVKNLRSGARVGISTKDFGGAVTPALINKINRDFWTRSERR